MFKLKYNKIILIYLLSGITAFSVFKYISSLKEKYDLEKQLTQTKEQAAVLEKEKQNLLQEIEKEKIWQKKLKEENADLKTDLKSSQGRTAKLKKDYNATQKAVEGLNSRVTALETEKASLKAEIAKVSDERDSLKSKLSSINELRNAMRDLKIQMRKVGKEISVKINKEKVEEGNQGFVIKDGKPTFPAKIKIEVSPASVK